MNQDYFKDIYIHDPDMPYPKVDSQHMMVSDKVHDYVYDQNFPYRLKKFPYNLLKLGMKIAMVLVAQPVCAIRYALKIKGKENIRKYKKIAPQKGMITVCNHTVEWDSIMISTSQYFRFAEFPIWREGTESSAGMMYRLAGGIPMPKGEPRGMVYSYRNMEDVLEEGKWLHVFPEAASWPFYPAVREFQPGTFKLAVEHKMPVLPMAVKYRANKGIYKLFKKHPNATLLIGEPILPDLTLSRKEAIDDMTVRTRKAVMKLLSIESEEQNTAIRNSFKQY